MRTPASHQSDLLNLPDIPVRVIDAQGRTQASRAALAGALAEWFRDDSSNLLIVMGGFGTGKTTGLTAFTATEGMDAAYLNFDELSSTAKHSEGSRPIPATRVVIFDNFDAINTLAGTQVEPPDLREVSYLAKTHRVILATRRSPLQRGDELLGQAQSEERFSQIGFRNPTIVQLLPWELRELRDHVNALKPTQETLEAVVSYLASVDPHDGERLRTPLLIKMLARLAPKLQGLNDRPTLASIYRAYSSVALAADYDLRRSQIPSSVKSEILADLAYDIFSGVVRSDGEQVSALSLPIERVSERVLESLMRMPAFRQRTGFDSYGWTEDFLSTNHMFEMGEPLRLADFSESQFGFVHQSFYEYFVSVALCRKISSGRMFGLDIEKLSMATVDSLAFAFAKELGGNQLRDGIREIVLRPRLAVADRLILFYFLEDETDFADILLAAPGEYYDDLRRSEMAVTSFFLKKMIRYQLVIAGQYDAKQYVAEVRQHEDLGALQAEERLHSAETGATQQLLARLRNPALEKARLITIYRLGQLGDRSAVEPLEWVATAAGGAVAEAARDAIKEIRQRSGSRQ